MSSLRHRSTQKDDVSLHIDEHGEIVLHKNIGTRRADFMRAVASFREGLMGM